MIRPIVITLGETLRNLKCLWLTSGQLDSLLGELMELMTKWTTTLVVEEAGDSEESKEELASSESEGVSG